MCFDSLGFRANFALLGGGTREERQGTAKLFGDYPIYMCLVIQSLVKNRN